MQDAHQHGAQRNDAHRRAAEQHELAAQALVRLPNTTKREMTKPDVGIRIER
jgi:hypothetical protein